ncbi:DUF2199 domain-containing protein [Streptomyces sp. NPDC003480]
MELGIGTGQPPVQVHSGDCRMAGQRRRAVGREEARRLLATGRGRTATVSPTPGCTSSTYRPRRRPGSAATPRNTRRCIPIPGSETEKPYFGWLTTDLSVYSTTTLNLKTHVPTRPVGERPRVELEPTDHPLAVEQHTGITRAIDRDYQPVCDFFEFILRSVFNFARPQASWGQSGSAERLTCP